MGTRMAANLARAGFPLTVWTHTPGKASEWAREHGGQVAATPAAAASASDIVITMVVDGAQVAATMLGDGGVLEGARPGLLAVDMSTIGPTETLRIGAALRDGGVAMLDAPVTGSSPKAQDGTLTIMVGGARGDFDRALPVLRAMGTTVELVGGPGQGQMLKLINNALGAANAAALAEALLLARAKGIDLDAFERIVAAGSGASAQLALKARPMRAHDFTTLFKTAHMLKDVRLCLQEAETVGVPFPAAGHAHDLLSATIARGRGEADYCALIEAVEGLAGREL
jgi:3-hydroxyisobutyrate dehydrogenase-like beta-hydroxyacid dehydrogenase